MLEELLDRAKSDPGFAEIQAKFAAAKVENWLTESEKVLHFAVGAFAPSGGTIVEIGSFQGGSACFLGAGLKRRGAGKLYCVDPHLGAPPWLGMSPAQGTLEHFRRNTAFCGVADYVQPMIGDSVAVASVWPAEPIDCVFIDGDHSFLGALKDFECWGPKLRPGGLVMIDDADDTHLPELLDMIEFTKQLKSVTYVDTIQGIAVFVKNDVTGLEMLQELGQALLGRNVHRPWDWSWLHVTSLPASYLKSKTWKNSRLDEGYQLSYLARCGAGAYGYTDSCPPDDRAMLAAVANDRQDGAVIQLDADADEATSHPGQQARFRTIFCSPEEAKRYAPRLLPGGLLLARPKDYAGDVAAMGVRSVLIDAGLDGCGFNAEIHWGIWQPHHLAPDAIAHYAAAASA
ncbi:class I SAM-dependent methyltransferase [Tundrisphaera sp. TA3]|uniref:class I SAM-dependent methyltransferase n=1 Tax=Tundrisphaera sp. TA3 TaxID=3435775 RepID=UPI003EBB78B9